MQRNIIIRTLSALACLAAAGCESDEAAYPEDLAYQPPTSSDSTADGSASDATDVSPGADIALLSDSTFHGYLADSEDRALYMFVNDVPGAGASTCVDGCLEKWPVFDVKDVSVGEGLSAPDFGRFLRADGRWQTTFKGHPLYYFALDGDTGEVSGDGVGGRWFVARDYFAFLGASAALTPEGATEPSPYLTNRAGRTSYVFMKDSAGGGSSEPVSACTDGCLASWSIWGAPPSLDNLIVPSTMDARDFSQFEREVSGDVVKQLSYRGWPLYYYTTDDLPGETSGHQTAAWRAIDPTKFAETGAAGVVPGTDY